MASLIIINIGNIVNYLLLSISLCVIAAANVDVELPRLEHPPTTNDDASLSFLVIGDWGRKGGFNQSLVAHQMGKIGEKMEIDFVVSTGDNFYDKGLTGKNDAAFEDSFTKIYTANALQKPWYSVLGNHDYRGDAEAQVSPLLRQIDPRWLCFRSFIVNAEIAEIFFIDTTPFVKSYFTNPDGQHYDWRGISSREAYISNLLEQVDLALRESTARWKIVVGHHAIRSVGYHGDTEELVQLLLPILRSNGVDLYTNGHDHCLEHISDTESPIQFLTSGAGSKAWRGDMKEENRPGLNFFYDGQGFMSVQLTQENAEIVFYDVFGEALHQWNAQKKLHSSF